MRSICTLTLPLAVSSLTSATVPAGRMPAAAWSLTTYLPTACSAVNSGIEMKETEREEAKPADEAKPGEAQPGEPRTEVL